MEPSVQNQKQTPSAIIRNLLDEYTSKVERFARETTDLSLKIKSECTFDDLSWDEIKNREKIFYIISTLSGNINKLSQILADLTKMNEELRQFLALLKTDRVISSVGPSIVSSTTAKAKEQKERVEAYREEMMERKNGLKYSFEAYKNLSYILTSNNLDGV